MEKFWTWLEKNKIYKALSEHKVLGKIFNREMISYLFFGVMTTVVSVFSFYIFNKIFAAVGWQGTAGLFRSDKNYAYIDANIISWIFAVAFAFITNKLFVFDSKTSEKKVVLRELVSFVGARLSTLLVDTALMFLFITIMSINEMLSKIIVQFVIVVLNYVLSKLFVFKKKTPEESSL